MQEPDPVRGEMPIGRCDGSRDDGCSPRSSRTQNQISRRQFFEAALRLDLDHFDGQARAQTLFIFGTASEHPRIAQLTDRQDDQLQSEPTCAVGVAIG